MDTRTTLHLVGKPGFLAFWIAILFFTVAPSAVNAGGPESSAERLRHTTQPVIAQPQSDAHGQKSGILAWLESFLPSGIRFSGPSILPGNQPEILATANCYDSGAGTSCNGFRNMQEYLAAVHASQNLGIPFDRLRARIQQGNSLHEAIRALRPTVNAQIESLKARQEAERTLHGSS